MQARYCGEGNWTFSIYYAINIPVTFIILAWVQVLKHLDSSQFFLVFPFFFFSFFPFVKNVIFISLRRGIVPGNWINKRRQYKEGYDRWIEEGRVVN